MYRSHGQKLGQNQPHQEILQQHAQKKRPDNFVPRSQVNVPMQPNQYTGPFGTPPKDQAQAPFWYMKKQDIPSEALSKAFDRKPISNRRPFDRMRGY